MGQYDITLKSMFRTGGRGFLKSLGVDEPLRPLDLEFASVKERRVDFLAEIGTDRLLHIEFQATKDANFVFRMLGYYGEILERMADQCRAGRMPPPLQTEIRQILIHLGEDRWRHADALRHANLSFRFEIVDVIDIDGAALVETGDVADAVVAILCRDGTSDAMIKRIVRRIARAPEGERQDAMAQLIILSNLRQASSKLKQEMDDMGITVNVENIEFLREPIDRALAQGKAEGLAEGKAKGLAEGLVLALDVKFGVIPARLPQLLAKLEPANLEAMMARVRVAASLEEVLGQALPSDRTISKD